MATKIKHKKCGETAFVYDHEPVQGEVMRAEHVVSEEVQGGSIIECESCGESLTMAELTIGASEDGETT